ncbi:MAG: phosphoribosylglycinamide formyltransferase [Acidimicrobiales bacterium]
MFATPPGGPDPSAVAVAVLASGAGTILEAVLAADLPVRLVVTDRPCRAIEVAVAANVASILVDRAEFGGYGPGFDRDGYTEALTEVLVRFDVQVVAMAGFGTVLGEAVHVAFPGRILNTHPALLPAFPGWHAVADALASGVKETGATVHIATPEMDAGPVLAQRSVPVLPDDTEDTLHERIKVVERSLYPEAIAHFIEALQRGGSAADLGVADPAPDEPSSQVAS